MSFFPYVILNCAVSLDGYLDDTSEKRLLLSNAKDFDRVDSLRASCDAILVGAQTIRKDNPRLLIRSQHRQTQRMKKGLPPHPMKVTITSSGEIDPTSRFFSQDGTKKLIYIPETSRQRKAPLFSSDTTIIQAETLPEMLSDLYTRGVRRLLVEGGSHVLTQFLQQGLVQELHVAIAPFFVGQKNAPRLVTEGKFPWNSLHTLNLHSLKKLADIAVLTYTTHVDDYWIQYAIKLSQQCPVVTNAFAVGAVIVDKQNNLISEGYSRETDPTIHAEEIALQRVLGNKRLLAGATLYSSLEPCNKRLSRPKGCSQLIAESGIKRVVFAANEPPIFVPGKGAEKLREKRITVLQKDGYLREVLAAQASEIRAQWESFLA